MASIIKFAEGFVYPSHLTPLNEVMAKHTVMHQYGQTQPPNTGPLYWMRYSLSGSSGSIAFLRRINEQYPEIAKYVIDFLTPLLTVKLDPKRVNLVKTLGNIPPHIDESGRKAAINIGVANSSEAWTHSSSSKSLDGWQARSVKMRVEEGSCYLLDTGSFHSVEAINVKAIRVMFTYAFGEPFDVIRQYIRT